MEKHARFHMLNSQPPGLGSQCTTNSHGDSLVAALSPTSAARLLILAAEFLVLGCSLGCLVGPAYHRPQPPATPAFKESPPEGWKEAEPNEAALKGKWWEIYNDPALNELEEQINVSNQNVLMAMAQYQEARQQVIIARSYFYPTLTVNPAITNQRPSANAQPRAPGVVISSATYTESSIPFDLTYQADLWGSIRHSVRSATATAQASAAQLENVRLTMQAMLAQIYFELHGADTSIDVLERTVKAYQDFVQLTKDRFQFGVASGLDVAQAETQLYGAQVSLVDFGVTRAQYEHAIAVLTGKAPSDITVSRVLLAGVPPPVPLGLPSELLERRPDIAMTERQVAAANEQIGIAVAALYPALNLNASAGLESAKIGSLFTFPSRFWSLGPQFMQTLFAGGRLHAQIHYQEAAYDATVANYRQTVLTALQQVEDQLAALRVLEQEAAVEDQNVKAARAALDISTDQYKQGIVTYLTVITAQTTALQDELAAVSILMRRLTASVQLIEALGGGWNANQLPTYPQIVTGK